MIRLLPSSSGRVQPTLVPPPHRYPAEEDITQIFWTPDMRRNTTDTSLSCWLCSGILDRYFPSTERDSLKNASWSSATSVPPYHHIPTLITSFPSRVGLQAETVCPRGTPRATARRRSGTRRRWPWACGWGSSGTCFWGWGPAHS